MANLYRRSGVCKKSRIDTTTLPTGLSRASLSTKETTVKADHCHERPPVVKDHTVLTEGPTLQCVTEPVTRDHLS